MAVTVGRRMFLYAGGTCLALVGGYSIHRTLAEEPRGAWRRGPFGPLRPDPDGVLDLPEGFSYRVLQHSGTTMSDGLRVPSRPDGMACFQLPDRSFALMRNHENPAGVSMLGPWTGAPHADAYSSDGMGGVTRMVLDPASLEVRSSNLVLGGSILNCGGGPSPWGWLTAEEAFSRRHGLVFVCDPAADRIAPAQPIPGYGQFRHEAACVDPSSYVCWLTEDRDDGCLYRFVPHATERPFEGELQAMIVRGRPAFDTSASMSVGDRLAIGWIPVREPGPERDVVRHHARAAGAAVFNRGEGITWDGTLGRTSVLVAASGGGPCGGGQIFRLLPDGDGGELVLVAQSERTSELDMPDNIVVAPNGIAYFCEDGHDRNYLRGLGHDGRVFDFAKNVMSRSELAGVCFSPDGRAMFLNLQLDGVTLAVTGPFDQAGRIG